MTVTRVPRHSEPSPAGMMLRTAAYLIASCRLNAFAITFADRFPAAETY